MPVPRMIGWLSAQVGRECTHLGYRCRWMDVIWPDGIVVLRLESSPARVHTDQYGQASFRMAELREVRIFGDDPETYSDEFLELLRSLNDWQDGA